MTILKQVKDSIYNKDFYHQLKTQPWSFSLVYYLKLISLLALIGTILLSLVLVPRLMGFLSVVPEKVLAVYPAELEIVIENGIATANVEQPYFVNIVSQLETDYADGEVWVVVDTETDNLLESFRVYSEERSVFALIGREGVVLLEGEDLSKVTYHAFPRDIDLTVNQENLTKVVDTVSGYFFLIPTLMVPIMFVVLLVGLLLFALWLVFVTVVLLIVYTLARDKGDRLTFGQMYRFTLHAVTLALILRVLVLVLLAALPGKIFILPFFTTVVTMLVVVANVPLFSKALAELPDETE